MSVRLKRAIIAIGVLAVTLCALAAIYYSATMSKPRRLGDHVVLIERGNTLTSVIIDLVNKKIIDEPYTMELYARINNIGTQIKAGEYQFTEDISLKEFLDKIVSGEDQIGIKVTFIEGWTFSQMRQTLNDAPKLKKITSDWSDHELMAKLGFPEQHPEGQFYPDTYHYRLGDSDFSIYERAFQLMQDKLSLAWLQKKNNLQINNPYEALTLASIIEKESQVLDEQPEISGVFSNRLEVGMRLQSDPTVIYGVGDDYDGDITRKHLKTDTPYNTYTRYGLPPTPICLPGYSSILAAVRPKITKALYFVAKGGGRHQFSKTLKDHNAAVKKYILGNNNSG